MNAEQRAFRGVIKRRRIARNHRLLPGQKFPQDSGYGLVVKRWERWLRRLIPECVMAGAFDEAAS